MLPEQKLDGLLARHHAVEAELATQLPTETYVKLSREFAELGPIVETVKTYRSVVAEIAGLDAMMADSMTDSEMRAMASAEKPALEGKRAALEQKIKLSLIPKDAMDERNVILEIRAGTGRRRGLAVRGRPLPHVRALCRQAGLEGRSRIRERRLDGWLQGDHRGNPRTRCLRQAEIRIGRAPRPACARHRGLGPHPHLDRHRRGAAGGGGGRHLHQRRDLKVDTLRAGGAGGQHVNKTESAIRLTHLPTGIVVMMQEDRSQHRNRAKAMAVLRARLYDFERQKRDSARAAERRGQVGTGDRSERIRTYNFPQGRVSDHRINLTLYKLPQIIEGEALGEVIEALVTEHQAELLGAEGVA